MAPKRLTDNKSQKKLLKKKRKLKVKDDDPVLSAESLSEDNMEENKVKGKLKKKKGTLKKKVSFAAELEDTKEEQSVGVNPYVSPASESSEESDDERAASEERQDPYESMKKTLSDMSFEDLQKLKEKVGLKIFNQVLHGEPSNPEPQRKRFKRENKNRPMEVSSKRKIPVLRRQGIPKKAVIRDPRFDDLSGDFNETLYKDNYSFINDIKVREKEKVVKKIKKEKNPEKKQQLSQLLKRMKQQEKTEKAKQVNEEKQKMKVQKEKQLVSEGKRPFYLKKSEKKRLELADKYRELKKSGKLDKYLARKRKKNASKERKKLPDTFE